MLLTLQELEERLETRMMERMSKAAGMELGDRMLRIEAEPRALAKPWAELSQSAPRGLSGRRHAQGSLLEDLYKELEAKMSQQISCLRMEQQGEMALLRQELKSSLAISASSHAEELADLTQALGGGPGCAGVPLGSDACGQLLRALEVEREARARACEDLLAIVRNERNERVHGLEELATRMRRELEGLDVNVVRALEAERLRSMSEAEGERGARTDESKGLRSAVQGLAAELREVRAAQASHSAAYDDATTSVAALRIKLDSHLHRLESGGDLAFAAQHVESRLSKLDTQFKAVEEEISTGGGRLREELHALRALVQNGETSLQSGPWSYIGKLQEDFTALQHSVAEELDAFRGMYGKKAVEEWTVLTACATPDMPPCDRSLWSEGGTKSVACQPLVDKLADALAIETMERCAAVDAVNERVTKEFNEVVRCIDLQWQEIQDLACQSAKKTSEQQARSPDTTDSQMSRTSSGIHVGSDTSSQEHGPMSFWDEDGGAA